MARRREPSRRRTWAGHIAVFALLAALTGACGDGQEPDDNAIAESTWELTGVWDGRILAASHPNTIATLAFTEGTASGSTGCNLLQSTYTIDRDSIEFGDFALTGSACEPEHVAQDNAMIQALQASRRFAISERGLELRDAAGSIQLQFRPAEELPLIGISWRLVRYGEGTSPLGGSQITLAFRRDGTLTGIAGCNSYFADYRIERDRLRLGPMAYLTEMECGRPRGVMEQEADYVDTFSRASSFATSLTHLELLDTDGTAIAEYRFAGRIQNTETG